MAQLVLGAWWIVAGPSVTSLVIVSLLVKEGREAWKADCDAIDPNRIVLLHALRDSRLRSYAIGTDREPLPTTNVDYIREVTNRKLNTTEFAGWWPSRGHPLGESVETDIGFIGVDAGGAISGVASAQILDAAAEEAYLDTTARAVVELGGARTIAGVALRKEGTLLGAITIYRQEVLPFTDKQTALLRYKR